MNNTQREIAKIAWHEGAHILLLLATGGSARRATLRLIHGAVIGRVWPAPRPGASVAESVAAIAAGDVATIRYTGAGLRVGPLNRYRRVLSPQVSQQVKLDIALYKPQKTGAVSGSRFDGDDGRVDSLLQLIPATRRDAVLMDGMKLVDRTLRAYPNTLRQISQLLLDKSTLTAADLERFRIRFKRRV